MYRCNKGLLGGLAAVFCAISMTGCGAGKESELNADSSLTATQESVASQLSARMVQDVQPVWAGAQFYDGEAVSIWRKINKAEDVAVSQDVYLRDSEGNEKLIVDDAPKQYMGEWFVAKDGYCFAKTDNKLIRIEPDGTEKYNVVVESGVQDICQLADGRFVIVLKDTVGQYRLAELNPDNGEFKKLENLELGTDNRLYITPYGDDVLLLKKDGFFQVKLETGESTKMLAITDYDFRLGFDVKDFRLMEGGNMEFLYEGTSEVLVPKDIEKFRTVITLRAGGVGEWLGALIEEYNRTNLTYYVEVQEWDGKSNQLNYVNEFYAEIESGVGPDLFMGDMMLEYDMEIGQALDNSLWFAQNGYLEDLAPYMEGSGVYEEDYFPCTFDSLRDGEHIYATALNIYLTGLKIQEEALGGRAVEDVETFVDALLAYPTPAVFQDNWISLSILEYLLNGSEDMWGAIDWENGTCDFQTDLFAKIMEASMLFGSDMRTELPEVADYIDSSFYSFQTEEQMRLAKEVYVGYFLDEGVFPVVSEVDVLAMSAGSKNKEGAWDFIAFLLNEETQTQKNLVNQKGAPVMRAWPVNILAFEEAVLLEMEEGAIVPYVVNGEQKLYYKAGSEAFVDMGRDAEAYNALYGLTEKEVEEMREMLYSAHYLPKEINPILNIVCYESCYYFFDEMSLGDVCAKIEERVQEYLDEVCK